MFDAVNVESEVHLAFGVTGYEFPDLADDWCHVRVAVRQGGESFEAVDPALEATDLPKIRDWFRALAADRLPRYARLSFTEPCLEQLETRVTPAAMSIGMNLENVYDFSPAYIFKDAFLQSRSWLPFNYNTATRTVSLDCDTTTALGRRNRVYLSS